jgi:hypothetical protein
MQGHDLIFFIQDKQFRFWGEAADGSITLSANPYPLDFSPEGWQGMGIQNVLNKKYWCIDRTVTLPFKYVEDGARILKHIFYTKGVEESVYLVICEQRLLWEPLPNIIFNVISGSNPFSNGTNTGTITGTPGETVYVKVTFAGDQTQDYLQGNIGSGLFVSINVPGSTLYQIVLPASGVANYNLALVNLSGTASGQMELASSSGATTGHYGYWYKKTSRLEVDLSTFLHDGAFVTANNTEEGFAKHLKANENTVYEMELRDVVIKDDGIDLNMKQPYSIGSGFIIDQDTFDVGEITLPMVKLNAEGLAPYVAFFDENMEQAIMAPDTSLPFTYIVNSTNYFCKVADNSPVTVDLLFSGKLRYQITTLRTVRSFRLSFWHVPLGAVPALSLRTTLFTVVVNDTNVHEFIINIPITAQPGDRFFFTWDRNPGASPSVLSDYQFADGSELSVSFKSRFQETFVKANRPQTVFADLISLISGGEYTGEVSPYLGEFQNFDKVFTSGNGLRSLDAAKLKMSFTDKMSFWNTYDEVGIQELPGKKILLDRKSNLIDQVNTISLGPASKLKVSFVKDDAFNELAIGYPDIKNETGFVNGKNEFNTTSVFSAGTTKNPKRYEKISRVQASCYAQEAIRIEQADQTTTDNRSDNDPFVMHIERTISPGSGSIPDHYKLDRSLNPFLTGVDEKDSIYNVSLSPKWCVNRSGDFLRSCFFKGDNKVLKFITADRNSLMAYINGPVVVVENADVRVGDLNPRFFDLVLLSIEIPAPNDLIDQLDAIPGRCFEFEFNGDTYKGISLKNSISPSSLEAQTYDLLSLSTNDLTKLIEYYGG